MECGNSQDDESCYDELSGNFNLTGDIQRPVILGHGTVDGVLVPNESVAYQELVESEAGQGVAEELVRVYFVPGMGHGNNGVGQPAEPVLMYEFVDAAIDALDEWVDYVHSDGSEGSQPEAIAGHEPL